MLFESSGPGGSAARVSVYGSLCGVRCGRRGIAIVDDETLKHRQARDKAGVQRAGLRQAVGIRIRAA